MKGGPGFAVRKSYVYHEALWESHSPETEVGVEPLPARTWGGRDRDASPVLLTWLVHVPTGCWGAGRRGAGGKQQRLFMWVLGQGGAKIMLEN